MAFRRNIGAYASGYRATKQRSTTAKARTGTFAASPAGRHRTLALKAFALAKKARAAGNAQHYWRMVGFGKRALALSKAEVRLWKRGQGLQAKSFATHRAATAKLAGTAKRAASAKFAWR